MGHPLELPCDYIRRNLGFRPSKRAVPRRDQLDGPEETIIPDGVGAACSGGDGNVGIQAVEGSCNDKGDHK